MVTCFYCGVRTGHWTRTEDVAERHARVSSDCQFLIEECGLSFIQQTLQTLGPYVFEPEMKLAAVPMRYIRPRVDSPFVQYAIECPDIGITTKIAKDVIIHQCKVGYRINSTTYHSTG